MKKIILAATIFSVIVACKDSKKNLLIDKDVKGKWKVFSAKPNPSGIDKWMKKQESQNPISRLDNSDLNGGTKALFLPIIQEVFDKIKVFEITDAAIIGKSESGEELINDKVSKIEKINDNQQLVILNNYQDTLLIKEDQNVVTLETYFRVFTINK